MSGDDDVCVKKGRYEQGTRFNYSCMVDDAVCVLIPRDSDLYFYSLSVPCMWSTQLL